MAEAVPILHVSAATDRGNVRRANEDAVVVGDWLGNGENASFAFEQAIDRDGLLLAVADGLGGHRAGEVASRFLVEQLSRRMILDVLESSDGITALLREIDADLRSKALGVPSLRGMGSTLAAAYVSRGWLTIFNVGDSRIYLWDDACGLRQISVDHVPSVRRPADLGASVSVGEALSPEFRRTSHAVTQAFGGHGPRNRPIEPYVTRTPMPAAAWTLLLCSDGLSDFVEEAELEKSLACGIVNADDLAGRALDRGSTDNVSVILARHRPTATPKP